MVASPDAATFAMLPRVAEGQAVARMFGDVLTPEGAPYEGDPGHVTAWELDRYLAVL